MQISVVDQHLLDADPNADPDVDPESVFLFEADPDSNPVPDFYLMRLRIRILIRIRLITLMRIWFRFQASRPFKKRSNRLIFNTVHFGS